MFDFKVLAIPKNVGTVLWKAAEDTVSVVRLVWQSVYMLLTGQFGINDLAGPVGTASVITQAASAGLESSGFAGALSNIVYLIMIITVNLGIMNLLPIPALDGGKIFFLIIDEIAMKLDHGRRLYFPHRPHDSGDIQRYSAPGDRPGIGGINV